MNSMNLLEIIGEAPEDYLLDAKKVHKRKIVWMKLATLAASCIAILAAVALSMNNQTENHIIGSVNQAEDEISSEKAETEVIYVVSNDSIVSKNITATTSDEVFNAWKTSNGIGEEVKLLSEEFEIPYNADEEGETKEEVQQAAISESLEEGEDILVIHISKEIENYYEGTEKEILLKSLQQTMTEFYGLTYEHCEIVFD